MRCEVAETSSGSHPTLHWCEQSQSWKMINSVLFSHYLSYQFTSFRKLLEAQHFSLCDCRHKKTYLLRTLVYSRVYMPFPGPPALKDPPPPIIMLRTQIGIKSGSWWEYPSSPITTWASSGRPDMPACRGIAHSSCGTKVSVIMLQIVSSTA